MNVDEPDDLEDDEDDDDDDDFLDDEEGDGEDDEEGSDEDEDDDEPETWQVVDFIGGNCLDWRDFPAQPGWKRFSRSRAATAVSPRWRP